MIALLFRDVVFINSIEDEMGKIFNLYADWKLNKLVYELQSGQMKESNLTDVIKHLRKIGYDKENTH